MKHNNQQEAATFSWSINDSYHFSCFHNFISSEEGSENDEINSNKRKRQS